LRKIRHRGTKRVTASPRRHPTERIHPSAE
jgi:hypothetical protein